MKKLSIFLLLITSICCSAQKKKIEPKNIGIANIKLNTVLKDTLFLNNEVSLNDRQIKEIRTYSLKEYKPNEYITLYNFNILTFNNVIYFITFDYTDSVDTMLIRLFGVDFEDEKIKIYKSSNSKQSVVVYYDKNVVFFIDKNISKKIDELKYKGL